MYVSYNLYTRNPEDIKIVVPYAIEATKAQSLRDVGIELLPFEEHEGGLTEEEYYSLRFHLPTDDCLFLMWTRRGHCPRWVHYNRVHCCVFRTARLCLQCVIRQN